MSLENMRIKALLDKAWQLFLSTPDFPTRPLARATLILARSCYVWEVGHSEHQAIRLAELMADTVSWSALEYFFLFDKIEGYRSLFGVGSLAHHERGADSYHNDYLSCIWPDNTPQSLPPTALEVRRLVEEAGKIHADQRGMFYLDNYDLRGRLLAVTALSLQSTLDHEKWEWTLFTPKEAWLRPAHIAYLLVRKLKHPASKSTPAMRTEVKSLWPKVARLFKALTTIDFHQHWNDRYFFRPDLRQLVKSQRKIASFQTRSRAEILKQQTFGYADFCGVFNNPEFAEDRELMQHVAGRFPFHRIFGPWWEKLREAQFEFLDLRLARVRQALSKYCDCFDFPYSESSSWSRLTSLTINAAFEIASMEYDLVVCVMNGGMWLGILLEILGVRVRYLDYHKKAAHPPKWLKIGKDRSRIQQADRILLCEDDSHTGQTLQVVVPTLAKLQPTYVDVAFCLDVHRANRKHVKQTPFYRNCITANLSEFNRQFIFQRVESMYWEISRQAHLGSHPNMSLKMKHNAGIWAIEEAFSKQECEEWRVQAEVLGFEKAGVEGPAGHIWRPEIRNNSRSEFEQPQLLEFLWHRLRESIPEIDGQRPTGLYRKLRFYRYQPGERFTLHTDGFKLGSRGEVSKLSCLIYLNDDFTGGKTRFSEQSTQITPATGMVLLYRHLLPHAGEEVSQGTKYILRTDVLYSDSTEIGQ